MNQHTLSVLVENEFGVLARVAGMFAARGYNIDSLSVAPTLDPKISRMTIVTSGSEGIIEQILKQLNRLIDVVKAQDLTGGSFINVETVLIKIKTAENLKSALLKEIQSFHSEVVEDAPTFLTLQLTGEKEKIESFLKKIESKEILELVRTGTIAIQRGEVEHQK